MIESLTVAGLATRHLVIGDANMPPVLLLHGWGAHLELLQPFGERLARQGYRTYMPDLPGFGETAPPPVPWSVADYVAWVLAYLESQSLEQVYLFGHSFGGRLSLVLGADHAGRLHKIVLSDSAGVKPPSSPVGQVRLRTYKAVRDGLSKVGLRGLSDSLRSWYNQQYGSSDFQQVSGVMRETFVKVVNEDLLPAAARIRVPTLLLWGERDQDTPLWQAELLKKTIPDAGLVVYPGAGHYAYLDRMAEAAQVTAYFYRQE
jgi:pimeloyl-ACP methyl ester carboxylesterase